MEEENLDYRSLLRTVKSLEKSLMEKEENVNVSIEGAAIEFSPRDIITRSYGDILNEIRKIEKIIAAVQYDMDIMNTLQQEEVPQEQVIEPQQAVEEPQVEEQAQPEERDNNKIVKKRKREKKSRESDE